MHRTTAAAICAAMALVFAPGRAAADGMPVARFVVIFLPNVPGEAADHQIRGFRIEQISSTGDFTCPDGTQSTTPAPKYGLKDLKRLLECAASKGDLFGSPDTTELKGLPTSIAARAAAAHLGLEVAKAAEKQSSTRAFAGKGQGILLVAFVNARMVTVDGTPAVVEGPKSEFTFKEDARESRFAADLQSLATVAFGIATRAAAEVPDGTVDSLDVIWMAASLRTQANNRSDITATHKLGADGELASDYEKNAVARWRIRVADAEAAKLEEASECAKILEPPPAGTNPVQDPPENLARRQNPLAIAACQLAGPTPEAVKIAAAEALSTRPSELTTILIRRALKAASTDTLKAALTKALAAGGAGGARQVPGGSGADTDAARTTTVISGPPEHWFISADVMLSDDLKIGSTDKGGLEVKEKPPTFYVGVGYLLGDLLASKRPLWSNIVLTAFVKGTKRPQESIGLAIGLRGQYLKWPALDFEAFSPFLAVTWTRTEAGQALRERKAVARVGVAVNLDKAIGWVK